MTFGERIEAARTELGLTRREVAKRIGISASYYGEIETGTRNPPSLPVIEKIRMTLMIDLDVLLYFSGHLPLHTHPREISDDRIKRAYDAFRAEMRRPEEEKE